MSVDGLTAAAAAESSLEAGDDQLGDASPDAALLDAASDDIPDIEMIDVSTGAAVNLRSLTGRGTPLLFWFWEPH